jgi:hypothetical protein
MKRWALLLVLAAGLLSARAQVLIRGDADYDLSRERVRMEAEYVTNYETNRTGLLRFRLWATENPWGHGGDVHALGIRIVAPLKPGQVSRKITRSAHLSEPDAGWWFVTLTLEERVFDPNGKRRWEIRDVFPFGKGFFGRGF